MSTDLYAAVLDHFCGTLGAPEHSDSYQRTNGAPELRIYKWYRKQYDLLCFCSVGYVHVPIPGAAPDHRLEFFLPAKRLRFAEAAHLILTCASSALDDGLDLNVGHSIQLRDPAASGSAMRRLFLTDPWESEEFCRISLPALHARVLMPLPIYDSELALIRKEGEESFWEAVEEEGANLTDYERRAIRASQGHSLQPTSSEPQ